MRTSAKNNGCSEVLIFILELRSCVKSDSYKILRGASVCEDLKNDPRIVSIGLEAVGIEARSAVSQLRIEYQFWKKLRLKYKATA